jgi:hypothetical protein
MEKSRLEFTHEFFDLWLKTYEATYGRIIEMPAMGPTREKYEKAVKSFNSSVNLYTAWMESVVNYQGIFMEAMRRVREKMPVEVEGEIGPEKYRDFYKLWIDTYSDTFKEFQKSGHFALDMGVLMSRFIDFQKINRELLEDNLLKPMNFPTRTEIDEINREVYSLKKKGKELAKQVKELSGREDIGQL